MKELWIKIKNYFNNPVIKKFTIIRYGNFKDMKKASPIMYTKKEADSSEVISHKDWDKMRVTVELLKEAE